MRHDSEIVSDQPERRVPLAHKVHHEIEDLRLDGDVEPARRLVGDEELRLVEQRHGDQHALRHADAELMGIGAGAPSRIRDADLAQAFDGAIPRRRLVHASGGRGMR